MVTNHAGNHDGVAGTMITSYVTTTASLHDGHELFHKTTDATEGFLLALPIGIIERLLRIELKTVNLNPDKLIVNVVLRRSRRRGLLTS